MIQLHSKRIKSIYRWKIEGKMTVSGQSLYGFSWCKLYISKWYSHKLFEYLLIGNVLLLWSGLLCGWANSYLNLLPSLMNIQHFSPFFIESLILKLLWDSPHPYEWKLPPAFPIPFFNHHKYSAELPSCCRERHDVKLFIDIYFVVVVFPFSGSTQKTLR